MLLERTLVAGAGDVRGVTLEAVIANRSFRDLEDSEGPLVTSGAVFGHLQKSEWGAKGSCMGADGLQTWVVGYGGF